MARGFRPGTEIAYMMEHGISKKDLLALPSQLPGIPGGCFSSVERQWSYQEANQEQRESLWCGMGTRDKLPTGYRTLGSFNFINLLLKVYV